MVKRRRLAGTARVVLPGGPGYDRLWAAFSAGSANRYTIYQARTKRPIPLAVIAC